mgnify:CR=1 FL=1
MTGHSHKRGVVRTLIDNSFLLIAGTVLALVWANGGLNVASIPEKMRLSPQQYQDFIHFDVVSGWGQHGDAEHGDAEHGDAEHGDDTSEPSGEVNSSSVAESGGDDASSDADAVAATTPDTEVALAESGGATDAEHAAHSGDEAHAEAGHEDGGHGGHHGLTIHFIINDILMALFFAIAAKEVWESMLPGGALSNPRKAATPLLATLGGVLGPALVYLAGCYFTGTMDLFGRGWAVPCATDIAFSYLVARVIFGVGHPAIAFLLLLAIADDAAGLLILAVFYPQAPVVPQWLLLTVGAMLLAWGLSKAKVHSHWVYLLIPGAVSYTHLTLPTTLPRCRSRWSPSQ